MAQAKVNAPDVELLDKYGSEGKPVVLARLSDQPENLETQVKPSIFVPIPIAA